MTEKVLPTIIKEVGFDFNWSSKKVWELNYPSEKIDIKELEWHFKIPFWNTKEGYYDLTPNEVINNKYKFKEEYERTMKSDLIHPIDIMENKGRWLILDGLHRLVKAKILGYKKIEVRKIPRSEISNIEKLSLKNRKNVFDDYNKIHNEYEKVNEKPDKKYSMLPTILKLAQPLKNKIVIDIGCGDGFFTFPLANEAKIVYGIDNSIEQIKRANKDKRDNTKFILGDMITFDYPKSDIICIPFVLDMIDSEENIIKLFRKFYSSLNKNGKVIGLMDDPKDLVSNNKKYGVIKKIQADSLIEGAVLSVELYNNEAPIITLNVIYHKKETIEKALKAVGFKKIKWFQPIISSEGINKFESGFWDDYIKNCDVAYFTAFKD